jgi:hypothetical protein
MGADVAVRSGATWFVTKLTAPDGAYNFGYSAAVDGDTAVVGAPGARSSYGTAYVFVRAPTT